MATKVFMEALSPTMEEGRLVKWLKNEGDAVANGETLAEVETDKAIMELVARGEGVLRKRLIDEGATAPVASLIAVIAAPDENIDSLLASAPAAAAPAQAASTAAPAQAPSSPAPPEPAAAPPAPPRQAPAPASAQPAPANQAVAGTRESAGASSVPRTPREAQGEASTPPQEKVQEPDTSRPGDGRARSSPLARRLAADRGLDLGVVQGSGPGGRVIKRDIEAAMSRGAAAPAPARARAVEVPRTPVRPSSDADFEDVPLTQIRKTIARRLAESIGPIPTFYLTADFDMERVSEMRSAMAEMGDAFKVSFNDIILKAVATALAQHPECNAHWLGDHIRYFNRVHLGMAVAIDDGLLTPVIFDADRKRMSEISVEARELAGRARERRLKPEEYTGSTFSVSNLGMFGIDHFTAIINPPECGILAIGGVEPKPVSQGDGIVMRRHMKVTMSCDHRVIDGATGAKFLQTLRRLIENPLMLVY